jgi:nucleoside-diphosphate-sugar epimerase
MQIAVIGANGFLGSNLFAHFQHAAATVVPVTRNDPLPRNEFDLVLDCNGDSRRFWVNENPVGGFRSNVIPVMERLMALSFETYVLISTIDVYGSGRANQETSLEDNSLVGAGLDSYAFQKLQAEELVRFYAPHHLILRSGTLIGPGLKKNPVFDALSGCPIRQTLDSTISLIDAGTLATVLEKLLANESRGTFNVTGKEPIRIERMLALVAKHLGRSADQFAAHEVLLRTTYGISIEKISQLVDIPSSESVLLKFLAQECHADT